MSFTSFSPDLSGSIFTDNQLAHAQENFPKVLDSIIPNWKSNENSPFNKRWNADVPPQTFFLIDLWLIIRHTIAWVVPMHVVRFEDKIKGLILSVNEQQFVENWIEMKVAHLITGMTRPILIEPYVSPEQYSLPNRPKSPDFGIQVGHEMAIIEATAIRTQSLDDYRSVYNHLLEFFQRKIDIRLNRSVVMEIPFLIEMIDLSSQQMRLCLRSITTIDAGQFIMNMNGKNIEVKWKLMPTYTISDEINPTESGEVFAVSSSEGTVLHGSLGVGARMKISDHNIFIDKIRRSLKGSLNRKMRQFDKDYQNILFLCLSDNTNIPEPVAEIMAGLLMTEFYKKSDYHRLSATVIYETRGDFSPSPAIVGSFSTNPNASKLASQDLIDMLSGEKTFFWWSNEFGRPTEIQNATEPVAVKH